MRSKKTVVTGTLGALSLGAAGLLPAAPVVAKGSAVELAATAVQPLTYEHVESWGGTGPGFNKHQAPAGIDTYGGAVFVADIDANAIEKKPLDSGSGTIWNYSEVASPALGRFTAPYDVAVVNDEVFYVADTGNNRVQRLERSTWTTVVATGSTAGKVQNPISIDVAPSGHFYVAEPGNSRIQEFTAAGSFVRSWGGSGDGPGQFSYLHGLAVAPDGSLYAADYTADRITHFSAAGQYLGEWSRAGSDPLSYPRFLDVGSDGKVYVTEAGPDIARVFDADGALLATIGTGVLVNPVGIDVDADGVVRVSDASLDTIETFRPVLAATAAPKVTGTAKVGKTLRASSGEWPVPTATLSYQWLRGATPIAGATGDRYKLKAADAGSKVSVRVTASHASYAAPSSASSSAVKVAKITPKVSVKHTKKSIKASSKGKITVTVKVSGVSRPTGKVRVYDGKKKIKTFTLKSKHRGKVTVRLPRLKAGKHKIKVTYLGTKQVAKKTSKVKTLTVKRR